MVEANQVLRTLDGRGIVSAPGCRSVRVRYRLVVEQRGTEVIVHGILHGSHAGLRPIWLEPDATLRLAAGRTLAVALTDLVGDRAEFEITEGAAGL